jgi:hypothetical protein
VRNCLNLAVDIKMPLLPQWAIDAIMKQVRREAARRDVHVLVRVQSHVLVRVQGHRTLTTGLHHHR